MDATHDAGGRYAGVKFYPALLIVLVSCGPSLPEPPGGGGESTQSALVVSDVSPRTWTAGTRVTVTGQHFTRATRFELEGQFAGADVALRLTPTGISATRATFVFEGEGLAHEEGRLSGQITARDGAARSDALDVSLTVGPSIYVTRFAPVDGSCDSARVSNTVVGTKLELVTETPNVTATWMDVNGELRTGTRIIDPGVPGYIDPEVPSYEISVALTDGTLRRTLSVVVHQETDIVYDGNTQIAEVYAPQPMSGCLPGGPQGSSFNYSESEEEEREVSWEASADVGVDLVIISAKFGLGLRSRMRKSSDSSLRLSHSVFRGGYGAFYRQTSRLLRVGDVVRYDACGGTDYLGSVEVTDWTWAPGFSQTTGACPPLPAPEMDDSGIMTTN